MPDILQWNEIRDNYHGGALLLGNGASMAVHPKFGYSSLRTAAEEAEHITPEVSDVFTAFGTDDFELVLRRLWQARLVNQALQVEPKKAEKVDQAYTYVREALIATVRDTHITYDSALWHLETIYQFMQGFKTVLSLNYDLIVYWAMMAGNNVLGRWFKDGFQQEGVFRDDWQTLREPYAPATDATLVFYPHGNLITARKDNYTEQKLAAAGGNTIGLLDRILEQWEGGSVAPLFVCEGTSEHKKQAIANSGYLTRVFREVIPTISPSLVIYGWNISDQDRHILEQLKRAQHRLIRVAVSVYGQDETHKQIEAQRMEEELSVLNVPELVFFDAASPGCWIHPAETEQEDAQ